MQEMQSQTTMDLKFSSSEQPLPASQSAPTSEKKVPLP